MIYLMLGLLGLCLGSFINALVWRTRERTLTKNKTTLRKLSISRGRSMCPSCRHELASRDLLPVVSWLMLKGKCRYCKAPISIRYPLVEIFTSLVFVFSYAVWPAHITGLIWLQFALWLILLTLLIALTIYDLKYMLLPNRLVLAAAFPVFIWTFINSLIIERNLLPVLAALYGLLAFGGVFYLIFAVSNGRWIGGGDVKLGFVLGAWLASPIMSFLAIFLASSIGTAIVALMSLKGPVTKNTKLPFGPMLITGFVLSYLFGEQITSIYTNLIL